MKLTGPLDVSWSFREGEAFRERVLRQALMLGFEAEEYRVEHTFGFQMRWRFKHTDGRHYGSYASCYSAALEYLRLNGFPMEKVGRIDD